MRVLGDERLGGRVNSFARGVYMDFTISVVLVEEEKKRAPKNLTRECLMHRRRLVGFARFSNTTYTYYTAVFYCHRVYVCYYICRILYNIVMS